MPPEELYRLIIDTLSVDELSGRLSFESPKRAENIGRVLYMCPDCGHIGTISSSGARLWCGNCGLEAEYTPNLTFKALKGNLPFENIGQWFDWEQGELAKRAERAGVDDVLFEDGGIRFFESIKMLKKPHFRGILCR
jgi:ribosomal protein S27AE